MPVGLSPTAGLTMNPNWLQYPSAMASCQSQRCRQKPTGVAGYLPNDLRLISVRVTEHRACVCHCGWIFPAHFLLLPVPFPQ
jgi:hypothetical protein